MSRSYKQSKLLGLILLIILSALILSFAFICTPVSATSFYVGHGGSNDSTGLSPTKAFNTLGYSVDQLSAGDTLWIMGGTWNEANATYSAEPLATLSFSSTAGDPQGAFGNPIVVKAYPDSSMPDIQGNNYTRYGVFLWYRDNIVFDSLEITKTYRPFFAFMCDTVQISNCKVHDARYWDNNGVMFFGNTSCNDNTTYGYGSVIKGNTIYDIRISDGSGSGGNCCGIETYCCQDMTIEDNHIYDLFPTGVGIFVKSGFRHSVIKNNIIHDAYEGMKFLVSGLADSIYNNLIYDITGHGMYITHKTPPYTETTDSIYVSNNTLYNISIDGLNTGGFISASVTYPPLNVEYYRNIIAYTGHQNIFSTVKTNRGGLDSINIVSDSNCFYETSGDRVMIRYGPGGTPGDSSHSMTLAEWRNYGQFGYQDSNSITGYPAFVDTGTTAGSLGTDVPYRSGHDFRTYINGVTGDWGYSVWDTTGDTTITQVITCTDTSITSLTIVDDFTLSNTVVDTVIFECSVDDFSSIVKSDTIGSPTDPDTSELTGLSSNTEYKIRCRCWDTSADVTDTSNVLTISTESAVVSKHLPGFRQ